MTSEPDLTALRLAAAVEGGTITDMGGTPTCVAQVFNLSSTCQVKNLTYGRAM